MSYTVTTCPTLPEGWFVCSVKVKWERIRDTLGGVYYRSNGVIRESEIILLCVRWYLRYSLSYRDLEEMMLERSLHVDHTTIYRWVQRYAPELEKCSRPHLKATTDSWRVDAHVCEGEKGVDVPLSGRGFARKHVGVPTQSNTRCSCRQAVFPKDAWSISHGLPSRHNRR